jgi:DNA mismatch repair protein MutL
MMGKIQVLSDLLANKIAAGEVVERPASVIKELLENAIDAEATEIVVEIEQGGLDLIKVSDNGIGMLPEDALTAFERHATSKIHQEKDLYRIRTLGFRGEALPSIASVAKVEMRTRTAQMNEGTLVRIEGGQRVAHEVVAARKGTEFAVRDLFFNTPARLKYLKSIQTEVGHVLDTVNRLALAHPHISFLFYQNGRQVLHTPGDGVLLHAVAAIYGHETAKQMLPVEWADYEYKVSGAVGFPELNRASRHHCSFFVNGRYVKSYALFNAVQEAYHTRLPINRYPVCMIHLELDPSLVDVNVHPNKLEVRFSEEKDVVRAVRTAVEQVLQGQTFIPKGTAKSFGEKVKSFQGELDLQAQPTEANEEERVQSYSSRSAASLLDTAFIRPAHLPSGNGQGQNGPKDKSSLPGGGQVVRETPTAFRRKSEMSVRGQIEAALGSYGRPEGAPEADAGVAAMVAEPGLVGGAEAQMPQEKRKVPQFRPVAQVLGMYVIAQDETGMYIIDQHAAHEKVLYEKFTKKMRERTIRPLPLLVPLTFELTVAEAEVLKPKLTLLNEMKIEGEHFGGTTFLVRSVPDIWDGLEVQRLLQELIDELLHEGNALDPRRMIEDKIIMKACKSAIKANQWLSMPEMVALCDQLRELDNPFTCPHGRPIIIHMSTYDLEKQFKRVM